MFISFHNKNKKRIVFTINSQTKNKRSLQLQVIMGTCLYLSFSPLLFASLLFTAICKASPDSHFAFLHFFSTGTVLIRLLYNVMNLIPQFIRHSIYQIQALKSISHFHCIIIRDLIQVIPEGSSGFPYFPQFKSEFGNKEFML